MLSSLAFPARLRRVSVAALFALTAAALVLSGHRGEPRAAAAADVFRVASGSYVGTGTARPVSVGFEPALVIVKRSTHTVRFVRASGMTASKPFGSSGAASDGVIDALTDTGFDIGTDVGANKRGSIYYWTAFGAAPDVMVVGSYAGNGTAIEVTTGFKPALVMVINSQRDQNVTLRFGDQTGDASVFGASASAATRHVTALTESGFTVGSADDVNESGETL
ncbi:MAG: hypothetical protein WEB13_06050 [Dehalococcoidia bacterium]